jgi:hypothetical protein
MLWGRDSTGDRLLILSDEHPHDARLSTGVFVGEALRPVVSEKIEVI